MPGNRENVANRVSSRITLADEEQMNATQNEFEAASFISGYDPPYDSPIEDRFAWAFSKYLSPSVKLQKQAEMRTICGVFRLDFLVSVGNRHIAIECDGKAYHQGDRDEWRDAVLLGDGCADVIFRFTGRDIHCVGDDCVYLMSIYEKNLFVDRGIVNLRLLASDAVKIRADWGVDEWGRYQSGHCIHVSRKRFTDPDVEEEAFVPDMLVIRRTIDGNSDGERLRRRYDFARSNKGCSLNTVIDRHAKCTNRTT
jgi:hypothetical protein